jgi:hypothetical protein
LGAFFLPGFPHLEHTRDDGWLERDQEKWSSGFPAKSRDQRKI